MATIDEKVVELKLDDSQLDKASSKTIKKLDQLKAALEFKGEIDSFKELEKAAKQVDMSPMEKGVEAVGRQFSALATIADAALRRITTNVLNTGERMLKSLTIDQITTGWSKYGEKTAAVQTIMAATAKEFGDVDNQMELVEEQLEKLNWFTDETSYRFLDMVNNIGKFTSNSVSLETSVKAMEGISTWAARSGANVNEAGRAMYNLSQAIAVGAVKLIDWKSIENANMATAEFKETAIDTAVSLGTLTKVGDGLYQTLKGNEVSVKNFNENLSDAWFTSEVLLETLGRYGEFADELNKLVDLTEMSTTSLIEMVDSYVDGTLDMENATRATGLSVEELTEWLEKLGAEENRLGREAFKAAQESKTFADVIDYVKEAVGSGWMRTFEYIFGNYEEAKELWSELAEGLYEVFVASGDVRNGLLKMWKEMGGRSSLIEGFRTILIGVYNVLNMISDAWHSVFPEMTAERLVSMTKGFERFTESIQLSEKQLEAIGNAISPLFVILSKLWTLVGTIIAGLEPLILLGSQILNLIILLAGELGKLISEALNLTFSDDAFQNLYQVIYTISNVIATVLRGGLVEVIQLFMTLSQFIGKVVSDSQAFGGGLQGLVQSLISNFRQLWTYVSQGEGVLSNLMKWVTDAISSVGEFISDVWEAIFGEKLDGSSIGKVFADIAQSIRDSGILSVLSAVLGGFAALGVGLAEFVMSISEEEGALRLIITAIVDELRQVWEWLKGNLADLTIRDVADIALVIFLGALIQSLVGINKSLISVTKSIAGTFTALSKTISSFAQGGNIASSLETIAKSTKWAQIAITIVALGTALIKLAELPAEDLGRATAALGITVGAVILLMKALEKLNSATPPDSQEQVESGADKMLKMGVALTTMATAVYILAKIDVNALAAGLTGVGVLMMEVIAMLLMLDKVQTTGGQLAAIAGALMILGLALTELLIPVGIMAAMDTEALIQGVGSLAVMLLALGGAIALMGQGKATSTLTAGLAMAGMALGLSMLVEPIRELGMLDWAVLNQGLTSVGLLITFLTAAESIMGKFGSVGGSLAGSVGILAMAQALNMLMSVFTQMATVSWETVGKGMLFIVGSLAAFAGVIYVMNLASAGLLAFAAAMASIGVAVALFGVGVKQVAEAVAILVGLGVAIGVVADQFGEDFPAKVSQGMDLVMLILQKFLIMIPALIPELTHAVAALILSFVIGINMVLPDILNGLMLILTGILAVVGKMGGPLLDAIIQVIDVLTAGIPRLLRSLGYFIEELFAGLGDLLYLAIVGLVEGLFSMLGMGGLGRKIGNWMKSGLADITEESVTEGVEEGVERATPSIETTMRDLKDASISALEEGAYDDARKAGGDLSGGYATGIQETSYKAVDASGDMTKRTLDKINEVQDSHSDSKEAMESGGYVAGGYATGIEEGTPEAEIAGGNMVEDVFANMTSVFDMESSDFLSAFDGFLTMLGFRVDQVTSMMTQLNEMDAAMYDITAGGEFGAGSAIGGTLTGQRYAASLQKDAYDAGTDVGTSFDEGVASGISSSTGSSSAAKSKAEQIADEFKERLGAIDAKESTEALEYKLWSALNVDVGEAEKKAKDVERATQAVENQIERANIAEQKYLKMVAAYGEEASESNEAYREWIQERLDLIDLESELIEAQASFADRLAEIELDAKTTDLEYQLWESLNVDAGEAVKKAKEMQYANAKVEYQLRRTKAAEESYLIIAKELGEGATQTKEAYQSWLEEQMELAELQNNLVDLQDSVINKNTIMLAKIEKAAEETEMGYKLWGLINKDASDSLKSAAQVAYLQDQIEQEVGRAQISADEWQTAISKYGSDSEEAYQAQMAYLSKLADVVELHNQLSEAQSSAVNDQADAWRNYGAMMAENSRAGEDGGPSLTDQLKDLGFTSEEIRQHYMELAGIQNEAQQEVVNLSTESMLEEAQKIVEQYGGTVIMNLDNLTPAFLDQGIVYAETITSGMTDSTPSVVMGAVEVVSAALEEIGSTESIEEWALVGDAYDEGLAQGMLRNQNVVLNAATRIAGGALDAIRSALGVASPSKETEWFGYMVDLGLVRGVEANAYLAARAARTTAQNILKGMSSLFRTSNALEFAGSMMADGILRGFENYSSQIINTSTALVEKTKSAFDKSLSGQSGYLDLLSAYGFDEGSLSYDLVLNLDTTKAYDEMNAVEQALYDLMHPNEEKAERANKAIMSKDEYFAYRGYAADDPAYDYMLDTWTKEWEEYAATETRIQENYFGQTQDALDRLVEALSSSLNQGETIESAKTSYTQNIYSTRPLSTLDVYRNTNKLLSQFS